MSAPRFTGDARRCVALPLGGIGTGHVALCGDGSLRQWQLTGRPNHLGFVPASFFALRVSAIEPPHDVRRVLQSAPVAPAADPAPNVTDHLVPADADAPTKVWSPVAATSFEGAYPFARVAYSDPELPLEVSLEAYTPFVPLDEEASALPLASFTFTLRNPTDEGWNGWLLGSLQNAVGWDGVTPIDGTRCAVYGGNVNRVAMRGDTTAIVMDNPSLDEDDPRAGELVLWTPGPAAPFPRFGASADALRFVESLKLLRPTIDGNYSPSALREAIRNLPPLLTRPTGPSPQGTTWNGALAVPFDLPPGEHATVELVLAWRFPNRYVDFDQFGPSRPLGASRLWLGNAYATRHGSALDAVDAYTADRSRLHVASRSWSDALLESTLPPVAVDVLLAQGTLVRSPTTFRTADGRFYGFEGALGASTMNWNGSLGGSCPLNCTHVWNSEQAVAHLFPALEQTMRETEMEHLLAPDGSLPHRVILPLWLGQLHGYDIGGPAHPALDGMLGAILKTYREVRLGAGQAWLERMWPGVRRIAEHVSARWDTQGDGILRGQQPVTYDIALVGPNMFVGSLWLAALRALEELARLIAPDAAEAYGARFRVASAAYDALLFNGEYYAQPDIAADFDFGRGCLSDQLFGQWWAHQLELGHLLPPEHVRSALAAVVRHNFRRSFRGFEHGYRTFADRDDAGLLVCTWPHGGRPRVPVRYCDEVWTGTEYQVAAHCLAEGLDEEGLTLLSAVRARYDGTRRNPYNEIECGDHYARAMAGFSVLGALTGFAYDAPRQRVTLGARAGRFPFVAGAAWGVAEVGDDCSIDLDCRGGSLALRELRLRHADGELESRPVDGLLTAGERRRVEASQPVR